MANKTSLDVAIEMRNIDIINDTITQNPILLVQINYKYTLPLHELYKNGSHDIVLQYVEKYPDAIGRLDHYNYNLFHIACVYLDIDILTKLCKLNTLKDNLNIINYIKETPLLRLLTLYKTTNIQIYYDAIILILEHGANPSILNITNYIINNFDEEKGLFLLEKLYSYGLNINIGLSAASQKSFTQIISFLVKQGCPINGNTFANLIYNKNNKALNILFDNINTFTEIKYFDKDLNILSHIALKTPEIDYEVLFKFIEFENINHKNMNHDTPLHYIIKYHRINNFVEILKNKFINIFSKNKQGIKPIDLVHSDELHLLIDLFTTGYLKHNKLSNINMLCLKNVRKKMFNERKCIKKVNRSKIIFFKEVSDIKFIPISFFLLIYNYVVLKSLRNKVSIPFICHNNDILYNNELQHVMYDSDIMNFRIPFHHSLFPNYAPSYILWYNENNYYFHQSFDFYLMKALCSKNQFIMVKLTIIFKEAAHANCLLYNKETNILERFDPYGSADYNVMDSVIYDRFNKIISIYNKNTKLIFYTPNDYMKTISLQPISDDTNFMNRREGDPNGFCAAWLYWFIEHRVANSDIPIEEFILDSINIINEHKYKSDTNNFINYIRNYVAILEKKKNNILIQCGISKYDIYNEHYTDEQQNLVAQVINNLY